MGRELRSGSAQAVTLFAYCASWAGGDEAIAQIKISAQCIQRTAKAILDSLAMITTGTP